MAGMESYIDLFCLVLGFVVGLLTRIIIRPASDAPAVEIILPPDLVAPIDAELAPAVQAVEQFAGDVKEVASDVEAEALKVESKFEFYYDHITRKVSRRYKA